MKKLFACLFVFFVGFFVFVQVIHAQENEVVSLEGEVVSIKDEGQEEFLGEMIDYQELEILVTKGEKEGEVITVTNSEAGLGLPSISFIKYKVSDKLRISYYPAPEGDGQYLIEGKLKRTGLIALTILFVLVVVVVGRVWGALSLVGLFVSFLVIFKMIIPLIINGMNPVLSAVFGAIVIVPTTFYISHGFNKKTHIGVVTTLIGLTITGLLAIYFVDAVYLTGYASEEAGFLQVERSGSIDIRGLLLAGIIVGTLGILDDVTIGQASTVEQLKKANPKMSIAKLFEKGMKVGQDHISSMVNTLVLVYSGSALPLLLLFFGSNKTFGDIVEFELIAEEIVRMLVGSIGLVISAPLATIMAAYAFNREK